jgi:hypothetical protein
MSGCQAIFNRGGLLFFGADVARINVEDELEGDLRFKALVKRLVDEDQALGMVIRCWRIAQKYWGDEQLIPFEVFELGGFSELLNVRLAREHPGGPLTANGRVVGDFAPGVYVSGSDERFSWYLQICQAARASANKKRVEREAKDALLGKSSKERSTQSVATDEPNRCNGEAQPLQRSEPSVATEQVNRCNGAPNPLQPLVPAPAPVLDKTNTPPKPPSARIDRRELEALADSHALRVVAVGNATLEAYDGGLRSTNGLTQWAEAQLSDEQTRLVKGLYGSTQTWLEEVFKRHRQADVSWQERDRKIQALGIELKLSFRGQLIDRARGTTGPPPEAESPVLQ